MAYECSQCLKVSKGKKKKSLGVLFKRHRCPGCGSYSFTEIADFVGENYDFEELVLDFSVSFLSEPSCPESSEYPQDQREDPAYTQSGVVVETDPENSHDQQESSYTPSYDTSGSSYDSYDSSSTDD